MSAVAEQLMSLLWLKVCPAGLTNKVIQARKRYSLSSTPVTAHGYATQDLAFQMQIMFTSCDSRC